MVSELVEFFAELTGLRLAEGKLRARHLREAGLLPSTGRGKAAARVSSIDCAVYLASWLAAERAINAAAAIRIFSELMPFDTIGNLNDLRPPARSLLIMSIGSQQDGASQQENPLMLPDTPFVEALARLIEWAKTPEGHQIAHSEFAAIGCARDFPFAFIQFRDRSGGLIQQNYKPPPIPDQPNRIRLAPWQMEQLSRPIPISIKATIPGEVIHYLADFLEESHLRTNHILDVSLEGK